MLPRRCRDQKPSSFLVLVPSILQSPWLTISCVKAAMDRMHSLSFVILLVAFMPSLIVPPDSLSDHGKGKEDMRDAERVIKIQRFEEDRYIVRFKQYKPLLEHKAALEGQLSEDGEDSWTWIHRNNPVAAFPTDFGVVQIRERKRLIDKIRSFDFVKDVSPEVQYSQGLLGKMEEDASRDSMKNPSEVKNPGKMFTNMSFQSRFNFSSLNFGRKLFMQRSQITSMFGAEKLRAEGYTGSKIKMAIFDTGIRVDHPHFRNIKVMHRREKEGTGYGMAKWIPQAQFIMFACLCECDLFATYV